MKVSFSAVYAMILFLASCEFFSSADKKHLSEPVLQPDFITDKTLEDTDDPAIWLNYENPEISLILGTDKGDFNGGIYVFDLKGKLLKEKSVLNLPRPNNIDVEYGFKLGGDTVDIAVFTQRNGDNIRVLKLPEMSFLDNGGIPVFVGDSVRSPMGVALYKSGEKIYAVISRKSGPDGKYLWQYLMKDSLGIVVAEPVRKFGAFKGGKEIEAIAVDDEAGFVYYSDEGMGIRKYHADPDSGDVELAFFAEKDFKEDHEGISIYPTGVETGYIIVSDQQANRFHVFDRRFPHQRLAIIPTATNQSDGSEVSNKAFGSLYPKGFFVAMSDNRTFQIYNWEKFEEVLLNQKKSSVQK
jgi:3-phytase